MKEILYYLKSHGLENDKYEDVYIDGEKVLGISIGDQYEHFIPTLLSFNDLLFDQHSNACEIIAKQRMIREFGVKLGSIVPKVTVESFDIDSKMILAPLTNEQRIYKIKERLGLE